MLMSLGMSTRYIDLISAYCDRWCERCAFTSRCSAFAAEVAIAMCGDVEEGLELAVGLPADVKSGPAVPPAAEWLADFDNAEPTPEESAQWQREEDARRARVDADPVVKLAWSVAALAHNWLAAHAAAMKLSADPVLAEALTVAVHDSALITVKLNRAVYGRNCFEEDDCDDESLVQNDWNGSAKLALLCLARSIAAWNVIAQASRDAESSDIAAQLDALRSDVERAFPSAYAFVRPGFDECG